MKTSVILCTHNRCESLAKALASLACLILPDEVDWEVVVVDNNSTDRTREIVDLFRADYPRRFRYAFEPRQGKSHAANLGIREADGEVLAFIDDDVTVDPAWLRNLTTALHNGPWTGAAGRILPQQSFTPPRWIPLQDRYALAPLALFSPDLDAGPLAEAPYGANMAFRRKMFEKYGGFRTDLGPGTGGGGPQKSEDSEFGHRLLAAGERLRYEPLAVVYHAVPAHRLQKRYFLAWWFDKARADIRAFGVPRDAKWRVAGIPLQLIPRLAVRLVRWIVTLEPRMRFGAKLRVWVTLGQLLECHRISCLAGRERSSSAKA